MAHNGIRLASVSQPEFGLPRTQPTVGRAEYEARIEMARARAIQANLDFLLVYGDREHSANLAFLTDHDPRFEEAMLVVDCAGGKPVLVLGNEGLTYAELVPVDVERRLFQGFSLPGQKRSDSPRLEPVLRACGIGRGQQVGVVGWKYATPAESDDPDRWLDVPAFIVDTLRALTGDAQRVINATPIFMNAADGLRTLNSADQLAAFEFAAAHCSQSVRNLIEQLRPGLTELEAAQSLQLNGLPLSAHLMLSSGPRARLGLSSPTSRLIRQGDPFFCRARSARRADRARRLRGLRRVATAGCQHCLCRAPGEALLCRGRRMVRAYRHRREGRCHAGGGRRCVGGAPSRHRAEPGPPDPPGRVGELAYSMPVPNCRCAPAC